MYILESWFILNSLICFYFVHKGLEEQAKDQIDLFEDINK
jgi:hypothetical protein